MRTPFGRHGGALAGVRTDDLAALPIRALIERLPRVDWGAVDEVILGCANQAGEDNRNVARMAGLLAGLPDSVPGVTVNRLCASGLEAVGQAARAIAARRSRPGAGGGRREHVALAAAFELRRRAARRALVSLCVGVGQGLALSLERPE